MQQGKYMSSTLLFEAANNRKDDFYTKKVNRRHFFQREAYKDEVIRLKEDGLKTPDYRIYKNGNGTGEYTVWIVPQLVIHFAIWYAHPDVQRTIYKWYDYHDYGQEGEESSEEDDSDSDLNTFIEANASDSDSELNAFSEGRTHKRKHWRRLSQSTDALSSEKKKRKHAFRDT